ncbi:MAG: isoprenylcysteine carboxylmethyltransferase family protein [Rhodobacteraceae bacterium]|nr:isoprenylcysteine carboxylmethyltransferase family protein [Paracoccaceae bacterium]
MSEKKRRPFDLPPVWLVAMLALAWTQARHFPMGLSFGPVWADLLGGLLVGGGVLLAALAIVEMRRQQTTVHPHHDSARLVQSGIFSRSRNPIYVGDVLILAGFILYWDAVLALPLVPIFLWVLEKRFVIPEENRLRRKFRVDFARYCEKVRRWV